MRILHRPALAHVPFKSPEDYAKWAAETWVTERANVERLGLLVKQ